MSEINLKNKKNIILNNWKIEPGIAMP